MKVRLSGDARAYIRSKAAYLRKHFTSPSTGGGTNMDFFSLESPE